jgi:hypothetical protein
MKFCPVVPGARKERRIRRIRIIIIRNGAKTISLQTLFGRFNNISVISWQSVLLVEETKVQL